MVAENIVCTESYMIVHNVQQNGNLKFGYDTDDLNKEKVESDDSSDESIVICK